MPSSRNRSTSDSTFATSWHRPPTTMWRCASCGSRTPWRRMRRDIAGLMATLTDDCVYELVQTGHRWEGKEGATRFYIELLSAFPDIDFALTSIVVGPQGVCEEAVVNGTFSTPWLGMEPNGEKMVWRNVIFFPWDPDAQLFTGERVYSFFPDLPTGDLPTSM